MTEVENNAGITPAIPEPEKPPDESNVLYSADEVARILSISRDAVYRRIYTGSLPAQKIGRRWMVTAKAISQTRAQPNRTSGTNRISVNISDELKQVLHDSRQRINQSAILEAGAWIMLAEYGIISYTQATNNARLALGKSAIVESAQETAVAIVG